jgi:hypothetical protein
MQSGPEDFFSGSIAEKLERAQQMFVLLQQEKVQAEELCSLLFSLRAAAAELDEHMGAMAMGTLCSTCAAKPKGGCCSAYMADNVDVAQLLINMLLGVRVVRDNPEGDECCFLGAAGCIFLIKPIFCLNYNCKQIVTTSSQGDLHRLDILSGRVLQSHLALEEYLLRFSKEYTALNQAPP